MSYVVVTAAALLVAALTLFSGFGLGTLLLPAFALFFPVELAVAATAVVHLANNLFKLALVGRGADLPVAARFIFPAVVFSAAGAWLLGFLSGVPPLAAYSLGGREHSVTAVKLLIALLMAGFALIEENPTKLEGRARPPGNILLGGAVSGFFGGLSGHQGAFRSTFLMRTGMSREAFIGTSVVCAVAVDLSRLAVYGGTFLGHDLGRLKGEGGAGLVAAGMAAAFLGSYAGARMARKVSMGVIHRIVQVLMLAIAAAVGSGLI